MKKKKLIIIIAAVLVVGLVAGGALMLKGKKAPKEEVLAPQPLDLPKSYQVENSSVPALVPREILVTHPLTEEQQAALEAQQNGEDQEEQEEQEEAEKKSFKERLKDMKEARAEKKAVKAQKKAEKKALKAAKKAAKEARKDADQLEKQVEKLGENVDASMQEQLAEAQKLAEKKEADYEALIPEPEEEPEKEAEPEEEVEEIPTVTVSYRYDYLPDLQGTVVDYINTLTSEENGFQVVDETYLPLRRMPNIHVPAGMLRLAKNSDTAGVVIQVDLSWQDSTCVVDVTSCPGVVRELKPIRLLSSTEAVDYLKRLKPNLLGLPGDNMDDYNVYALDGAVLINNYPCIRLNIYSKVGGGVANEIAGQFYLSADGEHLYRHNAETGSVEEMSRKDIPRTDILDEGSETDGEASEKKTG